MLFAVLKNLKLPYPLPNVDGFELCLDYLETIDIEAIKAFQDSCPLLLLFRLRKASQGGCFKGSEQEREKILEKLFALKPAFFDLEYDICPSFAAAIQIRFPEVKVICSYHHFESTPEDLEALFKDIQRFPAFGYKIAAVANSAIDALRMLIFVAGHENLCGICMGPYGTITRVLGPIVGNLIDYASLGDPSASGQIELEELLTTYRYFSLNRKTMIYALIGDPIDASVGAIAHNQLMQKYGINAVYVKIRLKKEELFLFFSLAKQLPFRGISVTMPLKEEVTVFLEENRAGFDAINTLNLNSITPIGYNTDGDGAIDAIERKCPINGKRMILIGAGGASKAIARAAFARGADVVVLNRTAAKAIELYQERGGGLERLKIEAKRGYDILVNTTPDSMPIDPQWMLPTALVMDIKSVPRLTPFLEVAIKKGCQVVYGMEMFIYQAAAQEKIWFGDLVNEAALREDLYSHLMI